MTRLAGVCSSKRKAAARLLRPFPLLERLVVKRRGALRATAGRPLLVDYLKFLCCGLFSVSLFLSFRILGVFVLCVTF